MDENEKPTNEQQPEITNVEQAPSDALSRTPDDLEGEQAAQAATSATPAEEPAEKKPSGIKGLARRVNVYLLLFILIVAIAAIITAVNYINSQKEPEPPTVGTSELTEEQLQQLATTDASVGDVNQTLTIRGNAVIDGQTLMRGNLNIAGNLQTGGSIQGPSLTISGTSNLGQAQINTLQVAGDVAIQGNMSGQNISIAGTSTFSGPMTASRISVTELVLSGNATLNIPNHISFIGPTPGRTVNPAQLGSGGSASVSGSDTSGTVNVTTGNSPAAGCMVRIVFNQQFSNIPRVVLTPIGSAGGLTQYYVERDRTGFSICAATPAPGNQSFAFDYFVMN